MLRKIHTKNRRTIFEWLTAVDYTEQYTQNVRPERIIRQPASVKDTHSKLFVRRRQSYTFYAIVRCVCRILRSGTTCLGLFLFVLLLLLSLYSSYVHTNELSFLFFYSAGAESTLSHLISSQNSFIIV